MKPFIKNYDLNELFPDINRHSNSHNEAKYYEILRLSPKNSIISGGQTGVDSIGLKVASSLGLPAFAIMPKNKRREGESINDYAKNNKINLRIIELNTPSYRFRTYANVFFADITIIFDFYNISEGTQTAIDASTYFNKTYILINTLSNDVLDESINILLKIKPNIINIAGNSLSKLPKGKDIEIEIFLKKLLLKFSFLRSNKINMQQNINKSFMKKLNIAIPNFPISKEIFKNFISEKYNIIFDYEKKLFLEFEDFNLIVARPREIINLVKQGIDIGFVGADLCIEYNYTKNIILDTGLIPNSTVIVSRHEKLLKNDKICSQYPIIAKNFFKDKPIKHISGSAEAFLRLGIYDVCVDSYQTGITVYQNKLNVIKKIMETSLVMIGKNEVKKTVFYKKFLDYLLNQ